MRDENRIFPFCNALAALWVELFPDLRFWQVVSVVAGNMESDYFKRDPFYAEEEDWLKAIEATRKQYANK